jgi:hypothetical protein
MGSKKPLSRGQKNDFRDAEAAALVSLLGHGATML